MKVLYRAALVLWLASGFAIHAYFSRVPQGTAGVESKQGQGPSAGQGVADRIARDLEDASRTKVFGAYAAWAAVGFVLALRGVHLLFRAADRVSDVEKFLAGSFMVLVAAGALARTAGPTGHEGVAVAAVQRPAAVC